MIQALRWRCTMTFCWRSWLCSRLCIEAWRLTSMTACHMTSSHHRCRPRTEHLSAVSRRAIEIIELFLIFPAAGLGYHRYVPRWRLVRVQCRAYVSVPVLTLHISETTGGSLLLGAYRKVGGQNRLLTPLMTWSDDVIVVTSTAGVARERANESFVCVSWAFMAWWMVKASDLRSGHSD